MPDVLLIEPCNFEDFPVGGQLSVAKQMISTFGNRLALVGVSTDETPIGRWVKKKFDGVEYNFFTVGRWIPSSRKPFIPARITSYLQMRRYKKEIMSFGVKSAFIQSPQTLIAIQKWGWDSICYCFPGVSNPLGMPRYRWGKLFAGIYERKLFSALRYTDTILASAGTEAIADLIERSNGTLSKEKVIQFPTRVDTDIFRPMDKFGIRSELGFNPKDPVIVSCGRLNLVKGWDFLLEAFQLLTQSNPHAKLIFVGDGEDRQKLQLKAKALKIDNSVSVTGFVEPEIVVKYLNASDLCVVGSFNEGWSVAMIEAIACGKPIVSTDVSGARDMIVDGRNGFVVEGRNPKQFAYAIAQALALEEADEISLSIAEKYTLKNLAKDLSMLWKSLA